MLMTWTHVAGGVIAVVTADNVDQAINQLRTRLIEAGHEDPIIRRNDLIPVVTHSRSTRILYDLKQED